MLERLSLQEELTGTKVTPMEEEEEALPEGTRSFICHQHGRRGGRAEFERYGSVPHWWTLLCQVCR